MGRGTQAKSFAIGSGGVVSLKYYLVSPIGGTWWAAHEVEQTGRKGPHHQSLELRGSKDVGTTGGPETVLF